MNTLGQKLPLLKKSKLSKKSQKEEDDIKRRLHESDQYWNGLKFQIHWNKLEWVSPRIRDERKNPFVCHLIFLKDNVKTAHWVGHYQLISLDTDDLFKITPAVDEK